jgi:hypothetical protein
VKKPKSVRPTASRRIPDAAAIDQQKMHEKRFAENTNLELGWDLAGKFARKSAVRTTDEIGTVRISYATIAAELRFLKPRSRLLSRAKKNKLLNDVVRAGAEDTRDAMVRYFTATRPKRCEPSLSERLRSHYQTDKGAKSLLRDVVCSLRTHLRCLNRRKASVVCVRGETLSGDFVRLLADEWLRDPETLLAFLLAVLRRWRKIDQAQSVWRRRMVIDQTSSRYGSDRTEYLNHLQHIGAIQTNFGRGKDQHAYLNRIGQDLSRDLRKYTNRHRQ